MLKFKNEQVPMKMIKHGDSKGISSNSPIHIGSISKVVSVDSLTLEHFLNLGCDYIEKGDFDTAIEVFNQAIKKFPRCYSAYLNRGLANMRKKEFAKAINDMKKAIKLNRTSADVHSNLGLVYQEMCNYDLSLKHFNTAIKFDRNHAISRLNRASVLVKKGDLNQARKDWIEVLKIDPCGPAGQAAYGNLAKLKLDDHIS